MKSILQDKVDLEATEAEIKEIKTKLEKLAKMEDQFDQCVVGIPETDEVALKLAQEIATYKERLEELN